MRRIEQRVRFQDRRKYSRPTPAQPLHPFNFTLAFWRDLNTERRRAFSDRTFLQERCRLAGFLRHDPFLAVKTSRKASVFILSGACVPSPA